MHIPPHLLRKLQEALEAEAAGSFVSLMESMDVNRGDIGELRHDYEHPMPSGEGAKLR